MVQLYANMYPASDLIGDFGSFTFIREVAAGGQGSVFVARLENGREVAVKAIRMDLDLTKEERQARIAHLDREMSTIKCLIHPNVVRHFSTAYNLTLSSPVDLPRYYVAMELCRGTLAREAKRNPINGFYLQKWSRDILCGLTYLHKNRIVHRDLKSDNIFLSMDGRENCVMKIGDLGDIKHLLDSFQQVSESRGTFAHMSPEMIKGTVSSRHCVFQKTDIWSFGSVLIEMLTGELPKFVNGYKGSQPIYYQGRGCETPIMFYVGRGGRPEICEEWPDLMKDVICSCLQSDPDFRPTAEQLLNSIFITGESPDWDRMKLYDSSPIQTTHELIPPIQVDELKHKMVKAIAFGSYGMIYQVVKPCGTDIAVKLITLNPEKDGGVAEQASALRRQFQHLIGLNHDNVIRHFTVGIHKELVDHRQSFQFYISMEFGRGGTLSHAVRDDPASGKLLYKWTLQIISGITYLHSQRIVHRTLNAHNVVLSSEDRETCTLKIAGLCDSLQLAGPITRSHEVSAIERFVMSPEMINGTMSSDFHVGRKTDIWNTGLIFIEMLTGRLPRFVYRNPDGRKNQLCRSMQEIMFFVGCGGRPEILDTWPIGCRKLIERCLQYSPSARPTSEQLLQEVTQMDESDFWSLEKRRMSSSQNCTMS